MKPRMIFLSVAVVLGVLIGAAIPVPASQAQAWGAERQQPAALAVLPVIDDFEAGLPAGTDPDGIAIGFNTFEDPNPPTTVAIATTTTPPAPAPGRAPPS